MLFYYSARATDGSNHTGSLEAENEPEALAHLRSRKLVVTGLDASSQLRSAFSGLQRLLRGGKARATFFRAFATLAGAGVPVQRALAAIVVDCTDRGFAETLRAIAADVDRGDAVSVSFDRHPDEFSILSRAMLRAGEAKGELDRALLEIAELEERNRALQHRLVAALSYPTIVCVAAAGLVAFLLASTMPAFAAMFAQMKVPLPLGTRVLIAAGRILGWPATWLCVAAVALAAFVSITSAIKRQGRVAEALDLLRLSTPALGPIAKKSAVVRFARTFGSLLRGGVDAVAALDLARGVSGSIVLGRDFAGIGDALRRGDTLVQAFEASGAFDAGFLQLVRAGEESGTLDSMLLHVASAYQAEVEAALSALGSAIEPVLICILGAAIGAIVGSIIVPLYSLIGSIR